VKQYLITAAVAMLALAIVNRVSALKTIINP